MPGIAEVRSGRADEAKDAELNTPTKRIRLRSDSAIQMKSPRLSVNGRSPNSLAIGSGKGDCENVENLRESSSRKLSYCFFDEKPKWNPNDKEQRRAVKEALHVSRTPSMVVCREDEQKRILDFCKKCIQQDKSGSLYVCGCPGTGKSLSVERVRQSLTDWVKEEGFQSVDVIAMNCTSFTNTSEIFNKILGNNQPRKRTNTKISPLQHLQQMYSQGTPFPGMKMTLIIADELDYLITKDGAVLHDLFMLTTLPLSRCILIGIANSIDLAEKFLPRLQSLNCKPMVISFCAYTKDQVMKVLQQRLMDIPYSVFQLQALELCAGKVAAVSGDMRKALWICRSAIEILEEELRHSAHDLESPLNSGLSDLQLNPANGQVKQEIDTVRVDHIAIALSKTYRSPIVDTIQSLPQHQQIVLCSAVKLFQKGKKDTTMSELSNSYIDVCKSILIPPLGNLELSSMCKVLSDQGLLKLGQSRQDKLTRVTLKVDEADIVFALQGIRVFRKCLQ